MPDKPIDFRKFALDTVSDFDVFIKFDPDRFLTFTRHLNDRIERLPISSTLYVRDCAGHPRQYNLIVKWFCWRSFISTLTVVQYDSKHRLMLTMTPTYDGITKDLKKL